MTCKVAFNTPPPGYLRKLDLGDTIPNIISAVGVRYLVLFEMGYKPQAIQEELFTPDCKPGMWKLFPTCQVRVVRFYQSCSSPPPPSSSPPPSPPPLPPLPCPLPPCQLFAKLFANFRTQWALLDLNCKGLSALGTAGPQPGTSRAQ